jgi:hypothetical protein
MGDPGRIGAAPVAAERGLCRRRRPRGGRSRRPTAGCSAPILADVAGSDGAAVNASNRGPPGAMARHGERAGAPKHFREGTRGHWPGLFHCDDVSELPRTDNDLSGSSAPIASTSGVRAAGRWPRRGRWFAGRRGCRPRWRWGREARSGARTWRRRTGTPGASRVPAWSGDKRSRREAGGSAVARPPTGKSLRKPLSRELCHPGFFARTSWSRFLSRLRSATSCLSF